MNNPCTPQDGPFPGHHPGFGFGFPPADRHALHEQRRQARRECRDQIRAHGGPGFGGRDFAGFGGGPGFGPGFGPGPFGGGRGGRRGPGRGGRGRRGDVRAAILTLLTERAMHGYEMIQEIAERSNGLWKPSPGSVYPTLQLLADEGLIVATVDTESESSRKRFELTDAGRAAAEKIETAPWDEIADSADPAHMNLRTATGQLFGAVAQSAHAATEEQQQRIIEVVNNARREIYQILGES